MTKPKRLTPERLVELRDAGQSLDEFNHANPYQKIETVPLRLFTDALDHIAALEAELASYKKVVKAAGVIADENLNKINRLEKLLAAKSAGIMGHRCHCEDVDFGEYTNTVQMVNPFNKRIICIDTCIATEIGYLWHQGVETLNSCCGHKKLEPTIIVAQNSIHIMKKLGYKNTEEKCANPEMTFTLKGNPR